MIHGIKIQNRKIDNRWTHKLGLIRWIRNCIKCEKLVNKILKSLEHKIMNKVKLLDVSWSMGEKSVELLKRKLSFSLLEKGGERLGKKELIIFNANAH